MLVHMVWGRIHQINESTHRNLTERMKDKFKSTPACSSTTIVSITDAPTSTKSKRFHTSLTNGLNQLMNRPASVLSELVQNTNYVVAHKQISQGTSINE